MLPIDIDDHDPASLALTVIDERVPRTTIPKERHELASAINADGL
jgi:hypothetical protein